MLLSEFLANLFKPENVFGGDLGLPRQGGRVEVDQGRFGFGDVSSAFGNVGQGVLVTTEVTPFAVALEIEVAALRDFVCCSRGLRGGARFSGVCHDIKIIISATE